MQRPSRPAVALTLRLAAALPGRALTGASTARSLSWLGCRRICLAAFEVASLVQNRPGDAGKFVGESDREHVVVQSLLGRLDPRLEPVAFPALWFDTPSGGSIRRSMRGPVVSDAHEARFSKRKFYCLHPQGVKDVARERGQEELSHGP